MDISRQVNMFDELAKNFSDMSTKPNYQASSFVTEGALDGDARLIIPEAKENYDNQLKIRKLKDTIFAVQDLLLKAKNNKALASAARSIPKSLHCSAMRLVRENSSNPKKYTDDEQEAEFSDPSLYHYECNLIGQCDHSSMVLNSATKNAEEPWKHVFLVVTNGRILTAMKAWFKMRPVKGAAHVEVKAVEDFPFLNSSYVPFLRQEDVGGSKPGNLDQVICNSICPRSIRSCIRFCFWTTMWWIIGSELTSGNGIGLFGGKGCHKTTVLPSAN